MSAVKPELEPGGLLVESFVDIAQTRAIIHQLEVTSANFEAQVVGGLTDEYHKLKYKNPDFQGAEELGYLSLRSTIAKLGAQEVSANMRGLESKLKADFTRLFAGRLVLIEALGDPIDVEAHQFNPAIQRTSEYKRLGSRSISSITGKLELPEKPNILYLHQQTVPRLKVLRRRIIWDENTRLTIPVVDPRTAEPLVSIKIVDRSK